MKAFSGSLSLLLRMATYVRKSKLFKFSLFLILIIVFLEIFLRINYREQLKTRINPEIFRPDSLYSVRYIPNSKSLISSPGVHYPVSINSHGFIGDEFNRMRMKGVFRIIIVGMSESTPLHMNSDNSYSVLLQKLFQLYGIRAEVINCAINGGGKNIQNLRLVKNELIYFQPDLILFNAPSSGLFEERQYVYEIYKGYTLNYDPFDALSRDICIKRVEKIERSWYITSIYDCSYIVRALCKKYIEINNPDWNNQEVFLRNKPFEIFLYTYIRKESYFPTITYSYTYERVIEMINEIKTILSQTNGDIILYNYGNFENELKDIYAETGIGYFELKLNDRFSSLPINSELEGHMNEIGHSLVAERLFQQIILNDVIQSKYFNQK